MALFLRPELSELLRISSPRATRTTQKRWKISATSRLLFRSNSSASHTGSFEHLLSFPNIWVTHPHTHCAMDSGSAPERANFPSPSRPSRCILGPRPPSFSNDNSNTASAEMFSPDPYSLVAASTQARDPQTSAIVPAFIPNDPQAQHPVIDPRLYEQVSHRRQSLESSVY